MTVELPNGGGSALFLWGDADCDTDIDSIDALKVLRYVAGLPYGAVEQCPPLGAAVPVTG